MSLPFVTVCMKRKDQVELCAAEVLKRLDKWRTLSSDKMVSLDEVAWLAALLIKAGLEPLVKGDVAKTEQGNVVTATAGSGLAAKDFASK